MFEGTWKVSTKRCDQLHIFFAVQTFLNFWWDLESFDKKVWPVTRFSLWRLTWVFEGTWKVSTKRSAQLHVFFAVETNLSFWRDLEKFSQKSVPSHMFLRCGDYLKFLMGLRKIFTKKVCPVTRFFAVETILSFWWDLESFGKKMWPVTHFFRSADFLKFLMGLGKFRQKGVTS